MSSVYVTRLPEKFDFSCHKKFNDETGAALKDEAVSVISLDFSVVSYLDSAALGMIVYLHKKAAAVNKKVQIRNVQGTAREILDVANINKLVDVQ